MKDYKSPQSLEWDPKPSRCWHCQGLFFTNDHKAELVVDYEGEERQVLVHVECMKDGGKDRLA